MNGWYWKSPFPERVAAVQTYPCCGAKVQPQFVIHICPMLFPNGILTPAGKAAFGVLIDTKGMC